jgi:hypothetical protein
MPNTNDMKMEAMLLIGLLATRHLHSHCFPKANRLAHPPQERPASSYYIWCDSSHARGSEITLHNCEL